MPILGVFTVIRWHLWRRCKTVTFGKWGPWEPYSQFKTMINIGQHIEVAERICMQQPHHAECISRINLCSLLFFVIYVSPPLAIACTGISFIRFAHISYHRLFDVSFFFFSQLLLFNSILTLNDSHELNSMREIYHGPKEIWDGIFFFVSLLLLRPKISIWSSLNLSSFDLLGGENVSRPIRKLRQR